MFLCLWSGVDWTGLDWDVVGSWIVIFLIGGSIDVCGLGLGFVATGFGVRDDMYSMRYIYFYN